MLSGFDVFAIVLVLLVVVTLFAGRGATAGGGGFVGAEERTTAGDTAGEFISCSSARAAASTVSQFAGRGFSAR